MARQAFYGDNEHRDYPFVTRTDPLTFDGPPDQLIALPAETIVDFGAIMFATAGFTDYGEDYVYLTAIARVGEILYFYFRTTAVGAADHVCVFSRNIYSAEEFEREWVTSGELMPAETASGSSIGEAADPLWEAFLVTGALDAIVAMLPNDGVVRFAPGLWRIEPARVQTLAGASLQSLSLANFPRTHATLPAGCGDPGEEDSEPIIAAIGMTGDIRFAEGYNAVIRQENQNNTLIIGAGVKAGAGEPCEEVPLYDGEAPPDGSSYLSGGPRCDEIVNSINGVSAANLIIEAGFGIAIRASDDDPNTLIVAADPTALATCLLPDETSMSSEPI
jgi:hypothetical protein